MFRLAIQPFVTFLNLFLAINAHSITFGKPPLPPADPHSVSARQATELEGCGIKDQSFVCDPDLVLTQEERDQLLRFLKSLESETRNPFGKTDCERKGLTVGVAISKTKITPEAEQAATAESSNNGHDWNEHNHHSHDEPEHEDREKEKDDKEHKKDEHHFIPYLPMPPANPLLTPCFVAGGLTLTQLLSHHVNNDNRFARELMRGWGIENETCAEKSAIILLSPVHQLPDPESDDLNCFYADKTNAFRQKRYLDGLLEMLEEQRQIHLDAKLFSAIETCRSLAALPASSPITETTPSTSAFTTPKLTNHTTNKTDPSNLTPADPRGPTISNSNKNAGQEEQHFDKVNQLEVEQWQKQQMQIQKAQYLQCSSTHTTNTLLILLFLTITSQTLLLVAIIVLKMRGFFNKPAAAIMPTATTVTSPPPMYNMKPVMSPPSFFDHLEDKKNGTFKR